ncbi:DRAB5-RELATED [Salix purpurea]|uniref:DRAB5-RELATED n=1 Tax=Salix purpurea TaxID=77065 RepID=A0A9Q0V2F9_SALPP|nr:DRAB5-RELATED [Salix purpurea]
MFWRDRERENKDQIGGPPCGQVRVLVVGDSGVGKTSLVHLIVKGSSSVRPPQTIGCTVGVKHISYGSSSSSSSSIKGDSERDFFIELWDVSGHDRYKDCRSLFYSQINGVIFVHDLSQRRTKTSLQKWASEISVTGTFSAPLSSGGPGGLPVPYIVIGNKSDVAAKEGTRGSSGNLVDAARQWVEKQGLLPSSEDIPLTESFPGSGGLIAAAKNARYDKEAVVKFFRTLIRRRYFSEELPAPSPWSAYPVQRSVQRLDENTSDEDPFYKTTRINIPDARTVGMVNVHLLDFLLLNLICAPFGDMTKSSASAAQQGDPYKYNTLPPLPAQRNLTPPPTLYPQQPVSVAESYSFSRFNLTGSQVISNTARSKRMDINV